VQVAKIKRSSEEVLAYDKRASSLSVRLELICPCCGSPVRLRSGLVLAPYFAHLNGLHDPDCENYHAGRAGASVAPHHVRRIKKDPSLFDAHGMGQPGVYLEVDSAGRLQLCLRFPESNPNEKWSGFIALDALTGERRLTWDLLRTAKRTVYMHPDGHPPRLRRVGTVAEPYWNLVEEGFSPLNRTKTIFRFSLRAGRMLMPRSPIYWGERYRILMKSAVRHERSEPSFIRIEHHDLGNGWIVLEIELPSNLNRLTIDQRQDLYEWLEHPILEPDSRLYLQSPFPFRFDDDGCFWISHCTEEVVLHLTGENRHIYATNDKGVELPVNEGAPGYFTVRFGGHNTICAYVDETLALVIRAGEDDELFSPNGIIIGNMNDTAALFESAKVDTLFRCSNAENINVKFGIPQLADCLSVNDMAWPGIQKFREMMRNTNPLRLDAGNLGSAIRSWLRPAISPSLSGQTIGKVKFLLSVASHIKKQDSVGWPLHLYSGPFPKDLAAITNCLWDSRYAVHLNALALTLIKQAKI
jgi:hypothetical protein